MNRNKVMRFCAQCKGEFSHGAIDAKCCSYQCSVLLRQIYPQSRTCALCGTSFVVQRSRATRFCSKKCVGLDRQSSAADRFWPRVDKEGPIPPHAPQLGPCWPWKNYRQRYGRTGFRNSHWLTHRVAYVLTIGEIPDGLHVLHKCDNTACCNPEHLFLGTHQDNMSDKSKKGRGNNRKLTEAQVLVAVAQLAAGVSRTKIARVMGVGRSSIDDIACGRTWRDLSGI